MNEQLLLLKCCPAKGSELQFWCGADLSLWIQLNVRLCVKDFLQADAGYIASASAALSQLQQLFDGISRRRSKCVILLLIIQFEVSTIVFLSRLGARQLGNH